MRYLLAFSLLFPVLGHTNFECSTEGETTLCSTESSVETANGCPEVVTQTSQLEGALPNSYAEHLCNEKNETWKKMAVDDQDKALRELEQECRAEAKAYKKQVFKDLMKKFKLGQALQVIFKSKKKIMEGSGENFKKFDAELSEEGLKKLKAEIDKKYPDLGKLEKEKTILQQKTVPFNMYLSGKGKDFCTVSANKFPEDQPFTPGPCESCNVINFQSSFTNDCSYMVNTKEANSFKFSEADAKRVMGIQNKKKEDYCQVDMAKAENNFQPMLDLSEKLCQQLQKRKEPNFVIETTRNLFADKTPQLAHKRGEFIQAFVADHLKNHCKTADQAFVDHYVGNLKDHLTIELPQYGDKDKNYADWKEGDYGPNPYSTDGAGEIKRYEDNVKREIAELEMNIKENNDEIAVLEKSIKESKSRVDANRAAYNKNKTELEKNGKKLDLQAANLLGQQMTETANDAIRIYNQNHEDQQKVANLKQRNKNYVDEIKRLQKTSQEKVVALRKYYDDPSKSDRSMFEDFKMVRVRGTDQSDEEVKLDKIGRFDPELKRKLEAIMSIQSYTCQLNAIETKKFSLQGALKGVLKVATIATLPVVAAGGLAVTTAAAPFTTLWGLGCRGCREPGKEMPQIYYVGNLTALDLSASGRAEAWDNTKGFIRNYVNWGGVLKLKGNKSINKHDLKTFHPDWEKLSEVDQKAALDAFFKKNFPEDFTANGQKPDTNGVACAGQDQDFLPNGGGVPEIKKNTSKQ